MSLPPPPPTTFKTMIRAFILYSVTRVRVLSITKLFVEVVLFKLVLYIDLQTLIVLYYIIVKYESDI